MTASFIPVFTTYMREKSKEEVWDFANKLFWTLALVVAVITVLGMVFSPAVVHLFAGKNVAADQAVELNRIVFPYLFFVALAALAMGILNCFHVFGLPAATPVVLNLATILFTIAAVWRYFKDPATSIVVGVLVGGVLQFLIQVPSLVQKGMKFNFGISFSHPGIRNVARLMIPRLFGIGIGQINLFVDTRFATASTHARRKPGGAVSCGPRDGAGAGRVRDCRGHGDSADDVAPGGRARILNRSRRRWPSRCESWRSSPYRRLLGLMILREPIIRVLFQHGQFVAESTRLTARALLYYAIGLPALATRETDRTGVLFDVGYQDAGDRRVDLAGHQRRAEHRVSEHLFFKRVQNGGPALATAIACFFDFFALFLIFRLRYGRLGIREILRSFGKNFAVLRDHGRGLLVWRTLHAVHDALAVSRAAARCFAG